MDCTWLLCNRSSLLSTLSAYTLPESRFAHLNNAAVRALADHCQQLKVVNADPALADAKDFLDRVHPLDHVLLVADVEEEVAPLHVEDAEGEGLFGVLFGRRERAVPQVHSALVWLAAPEIRLVFPVEEGRIRERHPTHAPAAFELENRRYVPFLGERAHLVNTHPIVRLPHACRLLHGHRACFDLGQKEVLGRAIEAC